MEAHAADGYPAARMTVIPNGVDTHRFAPDERARERVREEWTIGPDETLLGLVGRLDPVKGHEVFLRAFAPIAASARIRAVFVGTGPTDYQAGLQTLARELGIADRLTWSGPRTDMPAVYAALDLLVSASFGEGFSNVIAEAMACGVPCVVTDVGDSADIVADAGWVCRPDDIEDLRRAMGVALASTEERRQRSRRSRERIVSTYDTQRLVERTANQLRDTLTSAAKEA
jgi:glycosyltransferase involved in cell wall biosynthesis